MRKTRETTVCNCLAVLHIAISGAIGYTFVCKVTRSWVDGVLLNSYSYLFLLKKLNPYPKVFVTASIKTCKDFFASLLVLLALFAIMVIRSLLFIKLIPSYENVLYFHITNRNWWILI